MSFRVSIISTKYVKNYETYFRSTWEHISQKMSCKADSVEMGRISEVLTSLRISRSVSASDFDLMSRYILKCLLASSEWKLAHPHSK